MVKKNLLSRLLIVSIAAAILVALSLPVSHLVATVVRDQDSLESVLADYADDVSRLNAIRVQEIWAVPDSPDDAELQLVELLARARRDQLPVSIAGARHSMGAHTIAPDGIIINMLPFNEMSLSEDGDVLTVQAGALWSDVIPFLDRHGRSVAIMQSDSSFSVGGTLSVNAHGWQAKRPPISSSVKSFRLLLADGSILRCSREENAELFSLVLGGYGLFGIILEAELWTVPNEWYEVERYSVPAERFAEVFREQVDGDEAVEMAFGRLRVTPKSFLEDAVLTVYRKTSQVSEPLPALTESALDPLRRVIFRGSVESDYGKRLRWNLETTFGEKVGGDFVSRNQLLNTDVSLYANRVEEQTDIIHEYFVPPNQLEAFLMLAREIIPRHSTDLLNITLRDVREDNDTYLRYADQNALAVVMLFSQSRTEVAEASMREMTRELIDASQSVGGRYYLPYRPHATEEQFLQAYPQAEEFVELKRAYDPGTLFSNQFYDKYLSWLGVDE
ncbi:MULTISPECIES: FAD-binding oxidoreductase [unclassified Halomonas]|uniref:FAD-binding oxidoreductase n=1 Tax=unclassified Halomonas TaxID=2609666 RepID=UPI0009ED8696|nr:MULTISPECIES: FAD-binding oxidoreductase [unclassified Halomonas]MBT2785294.1 FAD-binding oxidoreductase [Halomonas sp. ISL-106]MBT2799315.1 FAD-binding oxidoreductase [Halomonas sp. ISL-104]